MKKMPYLVDLHKFDIAGTNRHAHRTETDLSCTCFVLSGEKICGHGSKMTTENSINCDNW